MNLEIIAKLAADEMAGKRSREWRDVGDKYYHGQRVAQLALRLRKLVFPQMTDKDDILTVAAWFHDIYNSHELYWKTHAESGAIRTRELLEPHCNADELDEICGIIAVHDERGIETDSVLLKLQQDADHLDHFGTLDIWTWVLDAANDGDTKTEALQRMTERYATKVPIWREELHFELSRKIYDEKTVFARAFHDRFAVELRGEIWDEARLLSEWDGAM